MTDLTLGRVTADRDRLLRLLQEYGVYLGVVVLFLANTVLTPTSCPPRTSAPRPSRSPPS